MVTVTNKEIYNAVMDIKAELNLIHGKVMLNRWIATTALTLILGVMTYISTTM